MPCLRMLCTHVDMGTGRVYPTNRWTMMTVTHDGPTNVTKLFLDAALVHECSQTLSNILPTQQLISLAPTSFWGKDLAGKFDEFSVWNGALTTNQIRNLLSGSPAGAGFVPASQPPPLSLTNITALMMPDRVQITWANGVGPFQIQCKADLASDQWVIARTTLGRSATLPLKGATAFYRVADLQRPRVTINVYTDKTLYAPGETITVTVESNRRGTLIVDSFDPRGSGDSILDEVVNLPSAPAQRVFTCTTTNEGRYLAIADLIFDPDEAPDTARTEFGVRRPELATVPKQVLRTETPALDVPTIRSNLQSAVQSGAPVPLPLGGETFLLMNVQRSPLELPPGEPLPMALQGAESFTAQVEGNTNSLVTLTVGPDASGGNDLHGMILSNPDDGGPQSTVWVQPLRLHDPNASNDVHLVYRGEDLLFPLNNHTVETIPEGQPAQLGFVPASGGSMTTNKIALLKIFEHYKDDATSRSRLSIVQAWRAVALNEFRNITPRQTTTVCVTLQDIRIVGVTNIATNGYGGTCSAVLNKFRMDNLPASTVGLNVLFTSFGTGCGGIAFVGQGSAVRWHCMVKDIGVLGSDAILLGQEVGHNWDWHDGWDLPNNLPHDGHLCGCISEDLGDFSTCTIMRATYGTCTKPELTYGRYCKDALRHLAEGILRYH